jgi:hypothetical protein
MEILGVFGEFSGEKYFKNFEFKIMEFSGCSKCFQKILEIF